MNNEERVIMAYDIETTGLNPYLSEIIEIGAIKVYPNKKEEVFQEIINIKKELPKKIIKITGITNEDIMKGKNKKDVLERFKKFIEDVDIVIGQNHIHFDNLFIEKELPNSIIKKTMFDTRLFALQNLNLRSNSLDSLLNHYQIDFIGDRHRALDDARATLELFYKMKEKKD